MRTATYRIGLEALKPVGFYDQVPANAENSSLYGFNPTIPDQALDDGLVQIVMCSDFEPCYVLVFDGT